MRVILEDGPARLDEFDVQLPQPAELEVHYDKCAYAVYKRTGRSHAGLTVYEHSHNVYDA